MKIQVRFLYFVILIRNLLLACNVDRSQYRFPRSQLILQLTKNPVGLDLVISRGAPTTRKELHRVSLDPAFTKAELERTAKGFRVNGTNGAVVNFELIEDGLDFTQIRVVRNLERGQTARDCFLLDIGKQIWFGGPQNRYQYWPIEKASFTNYSYVSKEEDNCGITERYWLNSRGGFIYIEDHVPLFIDQNAPGHEGHLCFSAQLALPYDVHETKQFSLSYRIGLAVNAREAHLRAVNKLLGKPSGVPDERMVRHPIWSTWARFKAEVNETNALKFANDIIAKKFNNSQLEIDDDWEICYGALTFRENKFSNIKNLTDTLKQLGFRVTLWIHPFINKNCTQWYNEAKSKGYLVVDQNGNPDTRWWNSQKDDAAYVDFTNPDAAQWWSDRLMKLQNETGIDSFKFDAGETSWSPVDPKQPPPSSNHPNIITQAYVRTVSKFGPIVEVRSGQHTQDLPIFVRMLDKDSEWGWNNGLPTLITTLFQLNFAGYPFVLPDMIGGNGYNNHPPDRELFLRWLQANVFMPSLQFSYVPWDFDDEIVELSLKLTQLHDNYTDLIMERFRLAVRTGEPVNPPIWWIDPEDQIALQIYDEFLLGDKILAAPVIVANQTERDIYLPKGKWIDGNDKKTIYQGPRWLMNYKAPLSVLPYFEKI